MPTYEFRCPNGHTFDEFHKISDAPQTATCRTCGAEAARAISGGAGLVFKGSGFYLTDYGKNAHRTSGPAAAGGESKGEGKTESKGDSAKTDGGSSTGGAGSGGAGAPTGGTSGSGASAGSAASTGGSSSSSGGAAA